jgi:two-component system, OmpR family, sensor kinase
LKKPPRRTLGTRLAWEAGWSVMASLLVFVAVASLVLFLDLREDAALGADGSSSFDELIEQLLWAALVAAPIAMALAVVCVRRAAQRATARVDALISSAAAISVDSLGVRVPESGQLDESDEIDQLAQTLNALLARIELGVTAQRQFAADASHELRTPLAVIINALEVARARDRSPAQWAGVADQTLCDARRLAEMVEALLHVARPVTGPVEPSAIQLQAVLAPLVARWKQRAPHVDVQLDLAPHMALHADARALEIVFDNLVANAVAQSRRGGTVRVVAADVGGVTRIAVEDDGPGIPSGERERIFKTFSRGIHAADLDGARPGVGLGLSIVRRIVEASQGRIFIDDAYHAGARFVMEFERQPAPLAR